MLKIDLKVDKDRERKLNKKLVQIEDCSQIIEEPCAVVADGVPALVCLYGEDLTELQAGVQRIDNFYESCRQSGLKNSARVFGFQPRAAARKFDYCQVSALARDCPSAHDTLVRWAEKSDEYYKTHAAEVYGPHQQWVGELVKPMWRMGRSVFTSGIVNKTSQLAYHFDRGNLKGAWSCMYVVKENIEGGDLSIPGLNLTLRMPHGTVLLFNGQALLHGVTPMRRTKLKSERYSVVYYTLDQMKACGTPQEELERAKQIRDQREHSWVGGRKPIGG